MSRPRTFKPSSPSVMLVHTFQSGPATYEQKFQKCRKPECWCQHPQAPDYAGPHGHGPYWYLCFRHMKGWTRIYLGKNLDTTRFRNPDGSINFAEVQARRDERKAAKEAAHVEQL